MNDNVTATYKKADENIQDSINQEAAKIASGLQLADRIEQIAPKTPFITIKDHKENFENNTKCRLINPAKSEIGVISKAKLQKINDNIREKTGARQWRNTNEVITWFNQIRDKDKKKLLLMDVVEFYPASVKNYSRKL